MKSVSLYEWRRFRSIRSTWIWCIVICVLVGIMSFATAWGGGSSLRPIGGVVSDVGAMVMLLSGIFAIVFAGMEYRHNTIRGLLVANNKRTSIFSTKLLFFWLVTLLIFAGGVIVYLLVYFVAASFKDGGIDFSSSDALWFWRDTGRAILGIFLFSSVGFALANIFRDYIVPIVVILTVPLLFEGIISGLTKGAHWTTYLPFATLNEALVTTELGQFAKHGGAFLLYTLVLLALAYWRFTKRDMNA